MKEFIIKEITNIGFHDEHGEVIARIPSEKLEDICFCCSEKYCCNGVCVKYDLVIDDTKE